MQLSLLYSLLYVGNCNVGKSAGERRANVEDFTPLKRGHPESTVGEIILIKLKQTHRQVSSNLLPSTPPPVSQEPGGNA